MITEQDLREAIAECQGQRNPNSSTCIKLAAFLIIQEHMFGAENKEPVTASYSYAPDPSFGGSTVDCDIESEFAREIDGREQSQVWPVINELMDVIHATNPRLYNGVMRKLQV